jgi:hypothetical protein
MDQVCKNATEATRIHASETGAVAYAHNTRFIECWRQVLQSVCDEDGNLRDVYEVAAMLAQVDVTNLTALQVNTDVKGHNEMLLKVTRAISSLMK